MYTTPASPVVRVTGARSRTRRLAASSVLLVLLPLVGCGSSQVAGVDAPAWMQDVIAEIASEPVSNPPTEIHRYSYQDAVVYYRPARCCDIPSTLWSADGAVLCHPDGGFAGDGDGRCPDFAQERSDRHLVWNDPRDGDRG